MLLYPKIFYIKGKLIMYDNDKVLNNLGSRVAELLEKYKELEAQNEILRNDLVSTRAQNEAKDNQILRLEEKIKAQNSESDDLLRQVEAVLGK